MLLWVCPHWQAEMFAWKTTLRIEPASLGCLLIDLYEFKSVRVYSGWYFGTQSIVLSRLLARRASRDAPRTKSGRLWTPKFWGERKIISMISPSILIYPKQNTFNSHYYYTFDVLINLMVYLHGWMKMS
jgi:hypothetical protein